MHPLAGEIYGLSTGVIVALVLFVVLQLGLMVWAVIDIVQRPAVVWGQKWIWLVIVIVFGIVGPLIYFAAGRAQPAVAEAGTDQTPVTDRARSTADLLYGPSRESHRRTDHPVADARASTQSAVEIRGLTKVYGTTRALDGVDLAVPEGSVYGFLGPNGAGKTTTLRILARLARPTTGSARILGHDVVTATNEVRAVIGFLPDVPGFYPWMTAGEFLQLSGELFGLPARTLRERVDALLDLAGLRGVDARIGGFSRGMKQRLGVAQALINAPRLLMLDEPTSALDPIGRREVLDMVSSLAGRTTVFFSTHILSDVERVCDRVAILDHGRVVAQAGIDELKTRHGGGHVVQVEVDDPARLTDALAGAAWVVETRPDGRELSIDVTDLEVAFRELPAVVAVQGLALRRLDASEVSLEEVFVDLVGEGRR
ncbi:MAG TPA: ATP-binding cassette domain-containing protein [Thermoleophilia bacterium]|nr:ATP-binding cassette domain-containing protein [Thermoleophilia bacterium]